MKDNSIIPYTSISEYDNDNDCSRVRVVRRKKKRKEQKNRWSVCILLFLAMILFICLYLNNENVKSNTDNVILKIKNTLFSYEEKNKEQPKDNQNDNNGDETTKNPPNDKDDEKNQPQIKGEYLIKEENLAYSNKFYNETSDPVDISSISYIRPNLNYLYSVYGDNAPVVLIIHSNANECYSDGISYSKSDNFYSEDENVGSLGKKIRDILNENNINTIHINNVFGNGVVHNSSKEYKKTVASILEQYPSISYIFDISRDVIINTDMTMTKPVFSHNDKKYAQIKFIVGSDKISENKNWRNNLALACVLCSFISQKNENLVHRYDLSSFSLNQNNDAISLKIDIGAYSNTYNEAYESALLLANYLVEFLGNQ